MKTRNHLVATAIVALLAPGTLLADQRGVLVDPVVGVWIPEVTQRDCASGAPLAVFKGFSVLHHGGTLSETNPSPPSTRGPGFGTWERDRTGYRMKFRFIRYYPDGNLAGYVVVRRTFTLSQDRNTTTGESQTEIQDPAGTVLFTNCATDVATRLQ